MFKLLYKCAHLACQQMLKTLQARLKQYMNQELPDVQLDLGKAEEPEIKLPICWIMEKARVFWKNIYFCFIDCVSHLWLCGSQQTGKFLPVSWETCLKVKI